MTNAQKWVTAFLIIFIGLFILSKVFESDDIDIPHDVVDYAQEENIQAAQTQTPDGLTLIEQNGCMTCHGNDLKGRANLGPSLYITKEHWDREELINYLRNPSAYSNDPRFDDYANQFSNIIMPAYDHIDIKDLGRIADHLLSLEEK